MLTSEIKYSGCCVFWPADRSLHTIQRSKYLFWRFEMFSHRFPSKRENNQPIKGKKSLKIGSTSSKEMGCLESHLPAMYTKPGLPQCSGPTNTNPSCTQHHPRTDPCKVLLAHQPQPHFNPTQHIRTWTTWYCCCSTCQFAIELSKLYEKLQGGDIIRF